MKNLYYYHGTLYNKIISLHVLIIFFFTGHCAKLWAIMKNSKVNKKASGKKWLVVVDDDTILRSVDRSVSLSIQSVGHCVCLSVCQVGRSFRQSVCSSAPLVTVTQFFGCSNGLGPVVRKVEIFSTVVKCFKSYKTADIELVINKTKL